MWLWIFVVLQVIGMAGTGVIWLQTGNWRLGVAEILYAIATIIIFAKF